MKRRFAEASEIWNCCRTTRPPGASEKKGGRNKASVADPKLEDRFIEVVSDHTAGDPMREDVAWTYLKPPEIARQLACLGTVVCPETVRKLLDEFGFSRRQPEKTKTMGQAEGRNEQFEIIADLKRAYHNSPNPIISMDTKKKELLGEFWRPGAGYGNGPNAVFDHDYPSFAEGKLVPHGLYDTRRNAGHLTLGLSHDTSQFACDSLLLWWRRHGQRAWPNAKSLLLLCDGGGSNNCRHHIFKEDLQHAANRIGLPIRVAHYPPYCSKYNPIEHRFFCHVTRAWSGVVFRSLKIVTNCLRRVWTSEGLKVTHAVLRKVYPLGRKASDAFLETYPIQFEERLPNWNYTIAPYALG